jgi:hypothetical protein
MEEVMMQSKKKHGATVKTNADYIQAEFDLSVAMGLKPKKFDASKSPASSSVVGTWVDQSGNALPAWVRDKAATFTAMATFQCFPSPSLQPEVFIQWGYDLESVMVPVAEHATFEDALAYAVTLAATEAANRKSQMARASGGTGRM